MSEALRALMVDAVHRADYPDVQRLLKSCRVSEGDAKRSRRLIRVAQLLFGRDLEDLARPPAVSEHLQRRISVVALPQQPSASA